MEQEFCTQILDVLGKEPQNANLLSPLNLAFIGDAIYEVVIRTAVLEQGNAPVNRLNAYARSYVRAQGQSKIMHCLLENDELSPQEMTIYKRGRNAKSSTTAKNASVSDYRTATGFEALMGYLYLDGQSARMLELIWRGTELADMRL